MDIQTVNTRRKILSQVVSSILVECGYDTCEKLVLETLTEMLQSFIVEIGASGRNYCELSGRTEPLIADVILALINMGIKLDNIETYAKRQNRTVLPMLQQQTQAKQLNILQAGVKQGHPSYIPSYFPSFPDPHAYIRTPTHKQPVTEYEAIREKVATQKRDIERALTRFIAKTGDTHSLFLTEDNSMFPLISCKPQFPSYISALLPQDQIFEPDSDFQFDSNPVKKKKEQQNEETEEGNQTQNENMEQNGEIITQQDVIDNPYLRPGKIPKTKIPGTTISGQHSVKKELLEC
ncbi:PREDICTED: transcription initiation factor TFIID subunit 8 [Cyphomyrmex costatus]|uniref:Transcription initiation factor TFIID subunit 8 n=1 Tax=Cyphomyrmex costatus TaxID=456900 RepID=A0A195C7L0_9HYME|nr:PREDICTED: transcription initiation factor TFIID subunit 8 [Cyphomyrmex costatus]KYM96151.1 Transcription initiation factor TFIID subunit 8 [Cyphomyrmex costatus]